MSPVGSPTSRVGRPQLRLIALTLPVLVLLATLAINLLHGAPARAQTATYRPAAASCSNSAEPDDTPAACSASAATLAPGGGVAIVENDNTGQSTGDDDLQIVFNLGNLDAGRVTGASLQVGSSQAGSAGSIQLGGPSISNTNYGAVSVNGGTTSSGALVSAVTASAGGSLTVWLQVACSGNSNDCGAAVDFVALEPRRARI